MFHVSVSSSKRIFISTILLLFILNRSIISRERFKIIIYIAPEQDQGYSPVMGPQRVHGVHGGFTRSPKRRFGKLPSYRVGGKGI